MLAAAKAKTKADAMASEQQVTRERTEAVEQRLLEMEKQMAAKLAALEGMLQRSQGGRGVDSSAVASALRYASGSDHPEVASTKAEFEERRRASKDQSGNQRPKDVLYQPCMETYERSLQQYRGILGNNNPTVILMLRKIAHAAVAQEWDVRKEAWRPGATFAEAMSKFDEARELALRQ